MLRWIFLMFGCLIVLGWAVHSGFISIVGDHMAGGLNHMASKCVHPL